MRPILYPATEKTFADNGLGVLFDATSCVVKEERNGSYELEMKYPVAGLHYDEITYRTLIFVKPSPKREPQPFRVYRISSPMGGVVTVYARHISYDLSGVALSPFSAKGLDQCLDKIEANAVPSDHGFSFYTDKTSSAELEVETPCSVRSLMGGSTGSMLDVYGGEYEFDRFTVKLWNSRGADRGVTIRYGKNLTSLTQEANCADTYTAVYPYWTNGETMVQLPEKTVAVSGTYDYVKVLPLDLSSTLDGQPSETTLRAAAERYITSNSVGVPKVSLTLSFAQLEGETVELCDTVSVSFERLGVSAKAKIVATTYNVLLDRYDSVEVGDARSSIADTIAGQREEIDAKPSRTLVEVIASKLASTMLGVKGGAIRFMDTNGDGELDELYIADNPDPALAQKVWRFNYLGWAASTEGYNGPFTMGATLEDGLLADFVTAAHLVAGTISSQSGNFFINLAGGTLDTSAPGATYTNADYTSTDEQRVAGIVTGSITPTLTDYEKYDITGEGRISVIDTVNVAQIVAGTKTVNFTTSWALRIDPSDGDHLFKIYRIHHDNITGTDTEYLVFSVGFANVVCNTVNARYGSFDSGLKSGGSIDAAGYKLNGTEIAFPQRKVIGFVVACTGGSSRAATCFIPYGASGSFQAASNDWYCGFSFDGYGTAVKAAGTGSVDSVTPVYNF